jgi:hypothetical protein
VNADQITEFRRRAGELSAKAAVLSYESTFPKRHGELVGELERLRAALERLTAALPDPDRCLTCGRRDPPADHVCREDLR